MCYLVTIKWSLLSIFSSSAMVGCCNLRICRAVCGECANGYFAFKNCTESNDEVCAPCSTCPAGMYTAETCNIYQDTLCGGLVDSSFISSGTRIIGLALSSIAFIDCGVCGVGEYISTPCQGFKNTQCSPCTICNNLQYASTKCELGHDAVCTTCEQCFFSDAAVRQACNTDRYRWWADQNCCFDEDGNKVFMDLQNDTAWDHVYIDIYFLYQCLYRSIAAPMRCRICICWLVTGGITGPFLKPLLQSTPQENLRLVRLGPCEILSDEINAKVELQRSTYAYCSECTCYHVFANLNGLTSCN
jgi:hypothetical protein